MDLKAGEDGIPIIEEGLLGPGDPEVVDALRRATPVVRTQPMRVLVLRSDDVARLSTDPRLLQLPGAQYVSAMKIPDGRCASFLRATMLMANGPEHHHLRGAFARTFSHPVVKAKRPEVRAVADAIVADLPRGEAFDFLDLCASRLPAEVIAKVLGLPVDRSRWFAQQVYTLSRCLMLPYAHDAHPDIEAAAESLYQFVRETLESRRAAPGDDLLSMLVHDDSARKLDPEVLIYQVMTIILAGSDTTRSGFNALVANLLRDRTLWDEVRADRALVPAAVEESLRIDPPVGSMPRFAPESLEVGGLAVAGGQLLGLSSYSAMRDEARLEEPGRFDLGRQDTVHPHLVFGGGAHRCLGEMLARIEMEEGLEVLLDGAPGLTMIEAPEMTGFAGIRKSTPMIARID